MATATATRTRRLSPAQEYNASRPEMSSPAAFKAYSEAVARHAAAHDADWAREALGKLARTTRATRGYNQQVLFAAANEILRAA